METGQKISLVKYRGDFIHFNTGVYCRSSFFVPLAIACIGYSRKLLVSHFRLEL
jgi:hypothetical protein